MNLETLKGFLNLRVWVVQEKLWRHLLISSFPGAGLISSPLCQTYWVTQGFCSCYKGQPSHHHVSSLPLMRKWCCLPRSFLILWKGNLERTIIAMYRSFASTMPCNSSCSSFRSLSYQWQIDLELKEMPSFSFLFPDLWNVFWRSSFFMTRYSNIPIQIVIFQIFPQRSHEAVPRKPTCLCPVSVAQ